MLLAEPAIISSGPVLARLWRNECLRIFHDRLISAGERQVSLNYLKIGQGAFTPGL